MRFRSFRGSGFFKFILIILFIEIFYFIHLLYQKNIWIGIVSFPISSLVRDEQKINQFLKMYKNDCENSLRNTRKNNTLCDCLPSVTGNF